MQSIFDNDMRIRDRDAVFVKGELDVLLHIEQHRIVILLLCPDEDRDLHAAVEMLADVDLGLRLRNDQFILGEQKNLFAKALVLFPN